MKNLIVSFLLLFLFASCSKSLVYSPSLGLTNKALKEKEIDFRGGAELMPETRPAELSGAPATFGLNGQLSYGFSDKMSLSLAGWGDVEGRENRLRMGYSLTAQFNRPLKEDSRLIFMPRIGMALGGSNISGYGLGASVIYQKEIGRKFSWYGGGGLLWGFHHLETERNADGVDKIPMGYGLIGNLGLGWQFSDHWRLNVEANPVLQLNPFDGYTDFLLSPTIGLGFTINKKQDSPLSD